jgi:hypothetical protein
VAREITCRRQRKRIRTGHKLQKTARALELK